MTRADRRTFKGVEDDVYSDFLMNFDRNPITGSLARITNTEAVKQSIKQIVLTDMEEWAFHPDLGSKVTGSLFEPVEFTTALMLERAIENAVSKEPRVRLVDLSVTPDHADTGYHISLSFSVVNATQIESMSLFLRRAR
jgi:phage baseplate assembly protein W